jgi:hypothetical protein
MIPQFADMPTATIEDNLFYSSIKLMPSTFLKKQKEGLTEYTATINDKLIPQFKNDRLKRIPTRITKKNK